MTVWKITTQWPKKTAEDTEDACQRTSKSIDANGDPNRQTRMDYPRLSAKQTYALALSAFVA
jgi:hypothetical protein